MLYLLKDYMLPIQYTTILRATLNYYKQHTTIPCYTTVKDNVLPVPLKIRDTLKQLVSH